MMFGSHAILFFQFEFGIDTVGYFNFVIGVTFDS